MRKYEVAHLANNGDIAEFSRIAPATAAFEESFAAFARGTLFQTNHGQMAIEDILPGDEIQTVDAGFQPLIWRGGMTIIPGAVGQSPDMGTLIRVSADSLGIARPMFDLILGPKARLFNGSHNAQVLSRTDGAYIPARDYIDGNNVIELAPPSPVQVFHLGFAHQHRVVANGVEVETQHPGTLHELGLRGDMLTLYMSLFPHVQQFSDFGALRYPRLRKSDLDMLNELSGVVA
ncbi:Hint domain-containing protein [Aestuariibius sp. HNIBRBA575]|uniref:Hint domain-containing protein n=1 Tax=Aestuariibius sp. HNIBRBA575 TaxID=3233343 RepID=UPI0034A4A7CA